MQYRVKAFTSTFVMMPTRDSSGTRAFHAALASVESQEGHGGSSREGCGSFLLSFSLPGLPCAIFRAVGLGRGDAIGLFTRGIFQRRDMSLWEVPENRADEHGPGHPTFGLLISPGYVTLS